MIRLFEPGVVSLYPWNPIWLDEISASHWPQYQTPKQCAYVFDQTTKYQFIHEKTCLTPIYWIFYFDVWIYIKFLSQFFIPGLDSYTRWEGLEFHASHFSPKRHKNIPFFIFKIFIDFHSRTLFGDESTAEILFGDEGCFGLPFLRFKKMWHVDKNNFIKIKFGIVAAKINGIRTKEWLGAPNET